MSKTYDVIVIGAGNAGQGAAGELVKAGKTVAIIESHDVGGTCPTFTNDLASLSNSLVEVREGCQHEKSNPHKEKGHSYLHNIGVYLRAHSGSQLAP